MTNNERKLILEIIELKKQIAELKGDNELLEELDHQYDAFYHGYSSFYDYDDLPAEKDEKWINKILDILSIYSYMINSIKIDQTLSLKL